MINEPNSTFASGPSIKIDGETMFFSEGETIYEVSKRLQKNIPTLCYDERLEAFGGCRLCVVSVEGIRNPVASCTTKATDGMVVQTAPPEIEKMRRTLLELVSSENRDTQPNPLSGFASQELSTLVNKYGARNGRFQGAKSGTSNFKDANPFILRDYEQCISCYRCVRVCAEQEGDYAISVANRGFKTQITTEFDHDLRDSDCTFCGQCVQTCPTGALADKKALRSAELPEEIKKTRTVCPYCAVGCSIDLMTKGNKIVGAQPAMKGPANKGALCIKGQFTFDFIQHEDRLKKPLIKQADGTFKEVEWDEALKAAAKGFAQAKAKYGRHSIYGIASGRAPHEAAYTMQKFIRAGFGTHHIDNCSRA